MCLLFQRFLYTQELPHQILRIPLLVWLPFISHLTVTHGGWLSCSSFGCTATGRSHLNSTVSVHDSPPLCVINCTECNNLTILCLLHWNKRQTSKWGRCTFYKDSLLQVKMIHKFEGLDKIIILISGSFLLVKCFQVI